MNSSDKRFAGNEPRRKFLKTTAAGLWGVSLLGHLPAGAKENKVIYSPDLADKVFPEPARDIPIVEETDVIVCGGGPAGFSAAIAAARTGAKVTLFEVHGCLGGVWTAGMLAWLFDFDKPGIAKELTRELDKRGARRGTNIKTYVYEIEEMKLLLEEKCAEAGVRFQLHTRVAAAYKDGKNRLTTVITESKSGRQAWKAKVFIDATGDGDLGALAGNGWDYGYKDTGQTQPLTFMSLITVDDVKQISQFISFYEGDSEHTKKWAAFKQELARAGIEPSYGHPTLFNVRDNLVALMINHEYGICSFNAEDMTKATVSGRAEVNKVVRALRKFGGPWKGINLVASCEQIGVREGRRIHGRYTVTDSDVIMGVRHKDAICHVTFGIDIHAATPQKNREAALSNTNEAGLRAKPYDIPVRALIAKDVEGLLMAGRCISGDFIAHASYRVTGNAVAMGQAAGTLAALSTQLNQMPHQVAWEKLEPALKKVVEISEKIG
jgi:hypothetical protein